MLRTLVARSRAKAKRFEQSADSDFKRILEQEVERMRNLLDKGKVYCQDLQEQHDKALARACEEHDSAQASDQLQFLDSVFVMISQDQLSSRTVQADETSSRQRWTRQIDARQMRAISASSLTCSKHGLLHTSKGKSLRNGFPT